MNPDHTFQEQAAGIADGLRGIVEKPDDAPSSCAVTGCYFYDPTAFDVVDAFWADCGESFDSLLRAKNLVATLGGNKSWSDYRA